MLYREAYVADISQIQEVRHCVTENVLSDPALVTDEDCAKHLIVYGKGWVCEVKNRIVGFAIADLLNNNIWALFVIPDFEGRGIGTTLHDIMLNWYFSQTDKTVWLSTAFNTRAERFYLKQGWQLIGLYNAKEVKFEMTAGFWKTKML